MNDKTLATYRVCLLLCVVASALSSSLLRAASKGAHVWKLSDVIADPLTGGYFSDSAEDRQTTEEQIDQYVDLMSGKLDREQQEKLRTVCESPPLVAQNPLCPQILATIRRASGISGKKKSRSKDGIPVTPVKVREAIRNKDYTRYYDLSFDGIRRLLKTMQTLSKGSNGFLDQFLDQMSTVQNCPPAAFLLQVGIVLEAELPDEKIRDRIISLYSRALKCGENLASVQAGFRLGLFHIWKGEYKEAEEVLSKVPDAPQSPDYRVRIGFWRFYCAKQLGDANKVEQMRKWLLREYPLSLHTILAYSGKNLEQDLPYQRTIDPQVDFRSTIDPGLNPIVRMVEGLLMRKMFRPAAILMESHFDRVWIAEVPFQLYWVVLLKRAEHNPGSFHFLAGVFRSNPGLISRDTLGLMYPVEYLSLIDEIRSELDPHLILSLIRQESAFDTNAKSRAGARGLMQIQPATAHSISGARTNNLYHPKTNISLGTKYLNLLLRRFAEQTEIALAAYNAGPGKIRYLMKRYPTDNQMLFLDLLPLRETRDYVTSIARNYVWYKRLYAAGSDAMKPGFISIWEPNRSLDENAARQ